MILQIEQQLDAPSYNDVRRNAPDDSINSQEGSLLIVQFYPNAIKGITCCRQKIRQVLLIQIRTDLVLINQLRGNIFRS